MTAEVGTLPSQVSIVDVVYCRIAMQRAGQGNTCTPECLMSNMVLCSHPDERHDDSDVIKHSHVLSSLPAVNQNSFKSLQRLFFFFCVRHKQVDVRLGIVFPHLAGHTQKNFHDRCGSLSCVSTTSSACFIYMLIDQEEDRHDNVSRNNFVVKQSSIAHMI